MSSFIYLFNFIICATRLSSSWPTVRSFQKHLLVIESNTSAVLPRGDGNLPAWQMILAVTSLFNTVQNFVTLSLTKRLYNNVPPTQPGRSSKLFVDCGVCANKTPQ
jgi:hypothetical protein